MFIRNGPFGPLDYVHLVRQDLQVVFGGALPRQQFVLTMRTAADVSFEAVDPECRPLMPGPLMPALKKDGSVAEAIALGVIKEHVVARHGAAMSRRIAPQTVVFDSAHYMRPSSSQETKPTLPALPQGSTAKPQGPSSSRQAWFSEKSCQSLSDSDEQPLPPPLDKWGSQYTDETLLSIPESDGQQTPPPLRRWGSVSDETLRTLERDRRLDTWLKRHGLSLPYVKLALQVCIAMLLICVWMAIPPVYGLTQPEWSDPGWAGITVILLLEPTAGATLAKTVLRVAGTVLGACFSALLLEALRVSSAVTDAVLICCVLPPFCALCAYCKARYKPYAYLWTVCSLTPTIVVLFSFEEHEQQWWYFAIYRCFNIVVGALVVLATAKIPPLAVRSPRPHPPALVRLRAPSLAAASAPPAASAASAASAAFGAPRRCAPPLQSTAASQRRWWASVRTPRSLAPSTRTATNSLATRWRHSEQVAHAGRQRHPSCKPSSPSGAPSKGGSKRRVPLCRTRFPTRASRDAVSQCPCTSGCASKSAGSYRRAYSCSTCWRTARRAPRPPRTPYPKP